MKVEFININYEGCSIEVDTPYFAYYMYGISPMMTVYSPKVDFSTYLI